MNKEYNELKLEIKDLKYMFQKYICAIINGKPNQRIATQLKLMIDSNDIYLTTKNNMQLYGDKMNKAKGIFNKKTIKEEIKKLEKELEKVKASNKSSWNTYGSELASGGMSSEERKIQNKISILKNKLEPTETYKNLVEKAKTHEHQLVFNCGPDAVLLLSGIEDDGEDYYWRMFSLDRGYYLSSCVGRIDAIKGKIDDEAYDFLFNIFRMNYKRTIGRNDEMPKKVKKEIEQILK